MAGPGESATEIARPARAWVAVIGIDRYRAWSQLSNAVNDARGVLQVFTGLGFEVIGRPLFDEMATREAIHRLVVDDLAGIGREDSLVLFFAGHGHTVTRKFTGTTPVKDGYLIPVDGDRPGSGAATWLRLESWLTDVSRIPARHILVVLDACHSGLALGPLIKWRGEAAGDREPLDHLRARRSRRIITSALDDQLALDSGPVPGHSLFTGCLIEALTGGLLTRTGHSLVTGSEIGSYVQRRVADYPRSAQTPDFGALELDNRGELVVRLAADPQLVRRPTTSAPPLAERQGSRLGPWIAAAAMIVGGSILVSALAPGGDGRSASLSVSAGAVQHQAPVDASPAPSSGATKQPVAPRLPAAEAHRVVAPDRRTAVPEARRAAATTTAPGCPQGMINVAGATFAMGSPEGVGTKDEHPQHQVTLDRYCIDITEVTVSAYTACVTRGKCTAASEPGRGVYDSLCNGTRSDRQDHPINCVTWNQATVYCAALGKRLPTEAEWEYAARGGDGRRYPWGNDRPSEARVNACGSECRDLGKRLGATAVMYEGDDGWEATAPVGSFPAGASPFGASDMGGNVAEWVADWFGPYTADDASNPRGPETGVVRGVRGGAWYETARLWVSAVVRASFTPTRSSSILGFRCARDDAR